MKTTAIALTTAVSVFAGIANADHGHSNDQIGNHFGDLAHFTVACTDQNGNDDDYSLSIIPETGLNERNGGHFVAEFNFVSSAPVSPYASPITRELDATTNTENFIFPLFTLGLEDGETHTDSRTVFINNKAHTVQFSIFEDDHDFQSFDNPDNVVTCDIPDMGFN